MEELILPVGGRQTLTLPGLGSAGYQWFFTVDDAAVARVEKRGTAPRGPELPQGSRDELLEIHALAAGRTVVHFLQRRAFEPDGPPRTTRDFAVLVK